jgi:hypothetical protein
MRQADIGEEAEFWKLMAQYYNIDLGKSPSIVWSGELLLGGQVASGK